MPPKIKYRIKDASPSKNLGAGAGVVMWWTEICPSPG